MKEFAIHDFDIEKYRFKQFFEDVYATDDLEHYLSITPKAKLVEEGYAGLKSSVFARLYTDYLTEISQIIGQQFYYQAIPTLRVQKPKDKAVTFHIDEWSGHGRNIRNFWLPIVDLVPANSLSIVGHQATHDLISTFHSKELSLDEFESSCREHAQVKPINYGQMLEFGNQNLHGATSNESNKVRLSIDFRAVNRTDDPGTKSVRSYYKPFGFSLPEPESIIAIVYCNNDGSHLSHVGQRAVISEFCAKNDFDIYIENNELLQVPHYPVLTQHLQKSDMPIVIFSVRCLPKCPQTRHRLLKQMRDYRNDIHFALENVSLSKTNDHYFDRILQRDNVFA